MTSHAHDWEPIPMQCAQYACSCGATGFRKRGVIVEHRTRVEVRRKRDVGFSRRTSVDGAEWQYHGTKDVDA